MPFLRYGDYYKSDLLLMVSIYCHEAYKRILLYLVIIKSSYIKNELRSSSAEKEQSLMLINYYQKRNMRASLRIWKQN